jgi:hypothetical protein
VTQSAENDSKPSEASGLVWVRCDDSVTTAGIAHVLQGRTQVHVGVQAPERTPSCVIICAEGPEDLTNKVEEVQYPDVPVLIFGLNADLLLARAALSAGTQGFIHAGMSPDHLVRAIEVAVQGEPVLPRALLLQLVAQDRPVALDKLSARQREVLELAADGPATLPLGGHHQATPERRVQAPRREESRGGHEADSKRLLIAALASGVLHRGKRTALVAGPPCTFFDPLFPESRFPERIR